MSQLDSVDVYDSEDSPFTISPLPPVLRHGLAAVSTIGFISFFTSLSLFSFLAYKMVRWHLRPPEPRFTEPAAESPAVSDVNGFLVPDDHLCPQKALEQDPMQDTVWERLRKEPPNQFLILIFNLLFADIQQSLPFLLNVAWLTRDGVLVGTTTCWVQGWFVSVGDLASSVFITTIAAHTYFAIVKSYRLPTWAFYTAIGLLWGFIYGAAILGVLITNNGYDQGGLYVRAGAWCWINGAYQDLRLYLHYLWIFISLTMTTIIYTIIFFHIQNLAKKARQAGHAGLSRTNSDLQAPGSPQSFASSVTLKELPPVPSYARQQTFLLYPLIYILCTMPLAAGRIASYAGDNVSLAYFCFAGAMISLNGFLDVALYATTRRTIVFSDTPPSQETGIETFAFMRTPPNRKFGNLVFVSGGVDFEGKKKWNKWSDKVIRAGGQVGKFRTEASSSQDSLKGFGMGQGSVMGMAIQCETVTSVRIEVDRSETASIDTRKSSVSSTMSIHSAKSRRLTG